MIRILTLFCVSLIAGIVSASDQPNILLITIDTVRADHLGCYGYSGKTSPNIDKLASRGILFRNAFAPTPLTLPSHASMLTGLYPNKHGLRDNSFFKTNSPLVSQAFKKAGFRTAAFVSAAPLLSRYGLNRGFDVYEDQFDGSERKAAVTADLALRWMNKASSPYFLWVHFFDPHAEYEPPPEFSAKHPGKPYDGEIAYADHHSGRLIDAAGTNTIIVVTSDHGEGLGEHGESTHGVFVYNSTLRVPIIMAGPKILNEERPDSVTLCDIAPTVLAMAGINPETKLDGISLLKPPSERTILAESQYAALNFGFASLYTSIYQNKKFILGPNPEFYNLKDDPAEISNQFATTKINNWKKAVDQYIAVAKQPITSHVSEEDREKLRSLGYVAAHTSLKESAIDPKSRIKWIEELNSAMALLKKQRYEPAEKAFRKLIIEEPESALGARFLANVLAAQKRFDEAAQYYTKSLNFRPDPETAIQLAKAYSRLNRIVDAESKLKDTIANFPEYLEARFELASLYTGLRRWDEALAILSEKDLPNTAEIHNQRGIIFLTKGEYKTAGTEFEIALKERPESIYFNNLGVALRQQNRFNEAESAFRRAVELNPAYEEAEVNLCFILIAGKRLQEARNRLERISAKNPRLWGARLALGSIYENLAESGLALKEYRKLAAEVPSNWPQRTQLEAKIKELER